MAFVPSHRHDIFVSYAHVDDLPFPGVEKGWVTTLVETLEILLAQKLGRREAYSLWMDRELSRHVQLTPEILSHLGDTATLLVILSPGYLASEWCLREKDTFLDLVQNRHGDGSRVFIVERDAVEFDTRPEAFRDLLGYRFWVRNSVGEPPRILGSPWPDPKNAENLAYFDELTRLSHNLVDELRALREADEAKPPAATTHGDSVDADAAPGPAGTASIGATAEAADDRPAVFVAETTDDLDDRRESVRRYLEQAGLRVLPTTWYPRDAEGFRRQAAADLAHCRLFVQLLGPFPGKRPPDAEARYAHLQHAAAVEADVPIVQWRSTRLDVTTVEDPDHRAFLEGEMVMAVGMEELKRTVVERVRAVEAQAEPAAAPAGVEDALVFINADASDIALAEAVAEVLDAQGIGSVLPLQSGSPSEVRADFEQNLLFCDGLIIVHGGIEARWVRDQMLVVRKLAWKRETPLRALGLLQGPPMPKGAVRFTLPKLITLEAGEGLAAEQLAPFVAALAEDP